jgi:hypothetical protein
MDARVCRAMGYYTPPGNKRQRAPAHRETLLVQTASHAQQWGELALVTLLGAEGLWTVPALTRENV